jgi:hypothetical protein
LNVIQINLEGLLGEGDGDNSANLSQGWAYHYNHSRIICPESFDVGLILHVDLDSDASVETISWK